ncbi:PhzF family phenazine biosynthesis protein [Agaribacter marinus]|uniref:Phenazine biosynthesis protein PhzF n=1 Tax=Agaribacter marinus TaxID=1431249 RepID=A0AA37WJ67_9ALTE|nr:PhzF family phenazine biosynthesis protein [Agaribacter marinus]GLR69455.1 phenazine biosynthesis protein PhzF [Agaribacter marinus]
MRLTLHIIDAFTDTLFKGNQAAVILLDSWIDDQLMQNIASENNLSETAFLVLEDNQYHIRWFSPLAEIPFCGHASLASAFVLFKQQVESTYFNFYAKAVGDFMVIQGDEGYIEMSFPNLAPKAINEIPEALIKGLSLAPKTVMRSEQAYFAIYDNELDVYEVEYNSASLTKLAPFDVVVTAHSNNYDFISRYFWPANGGDEDPVTGSIHAGLVPYWAEKLNKTSLIAHQASKRGGLLKCRMAGDRVIVSGKAVQYLKGEITV